MNSPHYQVKSPIALLVFNRPGLTRKIFERIREVKPKCLLIVADGARTDREGEALLCAETHEIFKKVDWDCQVLTDFSGQNLGCRKRISSGLSWVFKQVDRAIILEDDCLPSLDFFRYCDELLERYQDDPQIMHISGSNFHKILPRAIQRKAFRKLHGESYSFSKFPYVWGWASWRRAWRYYDPNIELWPELEKSGWLSAALGSRSAGRFWRRKFNLIRNGFNTWDYQWTFACLSRQGWSIIPEVNLISNLGFGPEATHTRVRGVESNLPIGDLRFPLTHPPLRIHDHETDQAYLQMSSSFTRRIKNKLASAWQGFWPQ